MKEEELDPGGDLSDKLDSLILPASVVLDQVSHLNSQQGEDVSSNFSMMYVDVPSIEYGGVRVPAAMASLKCTESLIKFQSQHQIRQCLSRQLRRQQQRRYGCKFKSSSIISALIVGGKRFVRKSGQHQGRRFGKGMIIQKVCTFGIQILKFTPLYFINSRFCMFSNFRICARKLILDLNESQLFESLAAMNDYVLVSVNWSWDPGGQLMDKLCFDERIGNEKMGKRLFEIEQAARVKTADDQYESEGRFFLELCFNEHIDLDKFGSIVEGHDIKKLKFNGGLESTKLISEARIQVANACKEFYCLMSGDTSEQLISRKEDVVNNFDPDFDEPQIEHLLQANETIRKDYPNEEWQVCYRAHQVYDGRDGVCKCGFLVVWQHKPKMGRKSWTCIENSCLIQEEKVACSVVLHSFVRIAMQMIFRYNILALVGAGANSQCPAMKVMIWDDHYSRCIGEFTFKSDVDSIKKLSSLYLLIPADRGYHSVPYCLEYVCIPLLSTGDLGHWLRIELKRVDREKTPWLIVLMHALIYNNNRAHYMEDEAMHAVFEKWFVRHKVDFVFGGHVHAYERSYRISNINYNVTNGDRNPFPDKSDLVYIIVDDEGNQEGFAERFTYPQPDYSSFQETSYGHSTLELKNQNHALYSWIRNDDGKPVATESVVFSQPVLGKQSERILIYLPRCADTGTEIRKISAQILDLFVNIYLSLLRSIELSVGPEIEKFYGALSSLEDVIAFLKSGAYIDPPEVSNRVVSSIFVLLRRHEFTAFLYGCSFSISDMVRQSSKGSIQAVIEFIKWTGNELNESDISRTTQALLSAAALLSDKHLRQEDLFVMCCLAETTSSKVAFFEALAGAGYDLATKDLSILQGGWPVQDAFHAFSQHASLFVLFLEDLVAVLRQFRCGYGLVESSHQEPLWTLMTAFQSFCECVGNLEMGKILAKGVDGSFVYNKGKGYKVPATDVEELKSPLMGILEKRQAHKFFVYVQDYEDNNPKSLEELDLNKITAHDLIFKYELEENTIDFISHALSLQLDDSYLERPAMETVKRMKVYAESLARFEGGSPYIYPLYGLGEYPQSFARFSVVYGGTYVLNKPECRVEFDENGKANGVISERETVKCKKVGYDPSYFPDIVKRVGKVARGTPANFLDGEDFIVLATEVVRIVSACPEPSIAVKNLVEHAVRVWWMKYPSTRVEGCAGIFLFLKSLTAVSHDQISERDYDYCKETTENEKVASTQKQQEKINKIEWLALEAMTRASILVCIPCFDAAAMVIEEYKPQGIKVWEFSMLSLIVVSLFCVNEITTDIDLDFGVLTRTAGWVSFRYQDEVEKNDSSSNEHEGVFGRLSQLKRFLLPAIKNLQCSGLLLVNLKIQLPNSGFLIYTSQPGT